ncbi:MAG: FAD-dependent monooxygenase [Planctomycetes bacterium]|nr:FAD-dependent monooxygenase [Planctomycetota bacterium]
MSDSPQVLIVGAGPTGLALACHCLRLGLRIRIIDAKPGPSVTSKAIGLQYRVSELLACMGVVDRFIAQGGSPTVVNLYAGSRSLVRLKFRDFGQATGRDAFAPRAIMLPQSETEAILGDVVRQRGGRIEWSTEFVDFEQSPQQVLSRLRHADGRVETVASQWLVSCEGAHSLIRKQAGIAFAGKTYPLAFFMADVELDWDLDHDENHVWFHQDGSFAALPLPKPRTWRLFVEVAPQAEGPEREVTLETIRELMRQRMGDEQTTISNPTWISEFRIHCRMVDRYRSGRVLLAGDAAHIHSPTGGQGIATGIQDATNLGWKLARVLRGAPDSLLDTYEQERLPHAREVLNETDRTTRILFAPTPLLRVLRDAVVLPVLRMDRVQKKLFAKLAQLHVSYRGSLSRSEGRGRWFGRTRLRAGQRAPDVAFQRSDASKLTTLFELLGPQKPVILIGCGPLSFVGEHRARIESLLDTLA